MAKLRFRQHEGLESNLHRVIADHVREVREGLLSASDQELPEAIHDARLACKKSRAALRLVRDGLGEAYAPENAFLRDTARQLAGGRDARVALELVERLARETGDAEAFPHLRGALYEKAATEEGRLRQNREVLQAVDGRFAEAERRAAELELEGEADALLEAGIKRLYKRGRRCRAACLLDGPEDPYHEWRKRVKYLLYALKLIRRADPGRFKSMTKKLDRLGDVLGIEHDCHIVRELIGHDPAFSDFITERIRLADLLAGEMRRCREEALAIGDRVYARKPKKFARKVRKAWSAWHPAEECNTGVS